MFDVFAQLCGGIGLFLLGMTLMTDGLKDIAGESLRQWLGRFTGSPLKAMSSGIIFTLIVQSSTATTLATIGFVSAGILTFAQSVGVIIGANIGTTSTGWMVALLGVKFSIGQFALPLITAGALLKILAQGRLALTGLVIAGFGLIFFGIELLQVAMSSLANRIDLSYLAPKTFSQNYY
ncbi:Na/Pi-cotransporter II-like protein [Acinetobacter sp. HA]|nr:Na/Pi-cotransporter II-like protein [Acinetobacter sp. HA]